MKNIYALVIGVLSLLTSTSVIGETMCGMVQMDSAKVNYYFYPTDKDLKGWWLQVVPLNAEADHTLPKTAGSVCLTGTLTKPPRLSIGWLSDGRNSVELTGTVGDGLFLVYQVTPNRKR